MVDKFIKTFFSKIDSTIGKEKSQPTEAMVEEHLA